MRLAVEVLVGVAAALTALGVVWRLAVRPAMAWARRVERAWDYVAAELQHDGGRTTRDAISRIDIRTEDIDGRLIVVEEMVRANPQTPEEAKP